VTYTTLDKTVTAAISISPQNGVVTVRFTKTSKAPAEIALTNHLGFSQVTLCEGFEGACWALAPANTVKFSMGIPSMLVQYVR
jgi:hypothetical protein